MLKQVTKASNPVTGGNKYNIQQTN